MPSYNKLILIGHLTRDPEVRATQKGDVFVTGGIAVNRKRNGEDHAMFLDFSVFGRPAEIIRDYLKKGDACLLEGMLELDRWEDKEGNRRTKHKMQVFQVGLFGNRSDDENRPNRPSLRQKSAEAQPDPGPVTPVTPQEEKFFGMDGADRGEIPF